MKRLKKYGPLLNETDGLEASKKGLPFQLF